MDFLSFFYFKEKPMKIFYGVQGTGNGHIARARMMAKELELAGIETTFLFSGRAAEGYFDMDVFKDYELRTGLTFISRCGKVNYLKTAFDAKFGLLFNDVNTLDLSDYDLVLTDFEPVSAWAAKKHKKPLLGIGNQFAYHYSIPREGSDPIADFVMKYFAPADKAIGLHWHHFGQPLFPPIMDSLTLSSEHIKNKIIVYLPFEDQNEVVKLLAPFENYQFHLSTPHPVESKFAHITFTPMCIEQFQRDLHDCGGVICNAGFALVSEALQLGKKILVKPLHAQMEQTSNAAALKQLGYAHIMNQLDINMIEHWLHYQQSVHITYPNTARILTQWIQEGMPDMDDDFIEAVWDKVDIVHVAH